MATWGATPPPPFLSVSPLESMRSGGAIPALKRGISAILARYPMKTRQMGAIPPSAILSRKGIARYGGGISHWAAKVLYKKRGSGNPKKGGTAKRELLRVPSHFRLHLKSGTHQSRVTPDRGPLADFCCLLPAFLGSKHG